MQSGASLVLHRCETAWARASQPVEITGWTARCRSVANPRAEPAIRVQASAGLCKRVQTWAAFGFVGADLRLTYVRQNMQGSINTAFEASGGSKPAQPEAGKPKLLAVSLLYTEHEDGEAPARPLTAREVAQALGIGIESVRELCHRGVLEHFKVGNHFRVSREEIARFIRQHTKRRRARDMMVEVKRSGGR